MLQNLLLWFNLALVACSLVLLLPIPLRLVDSFRPLIPWLCCTCFCSFFVSAYLWRAASRRPIRRFRGVLLLPILFLLLWFPIRYFPRTFPEWFGREVHPLGSHLEVRLSATAGNVSVVGEAASVSEAQPLNLGILAPQFLVSALRHEGRNLKLIEYIPDESQGDYHTLRRGLRRLGTLLRHNPESAVVVIRSQASPWIRKWQVLEEISGLTRGLRADGIAGGPPWLGRSSWHVFHSPDVSLQVRNDTGKSLELAIAKNK